MTCVERVTRLPKRGVKQLHFQAANAGETPQASVVSVYDPLVLVLPLQLEQVEERERGKFL